MSLLKTAKQYHPTKDKKTVAPSVRRVPHNVLLSVFLKPGKNISVYVFSVVLVKNLVSVTGVEDYLRLVTRRFKIIAYVYNALTVEADGVLCTGNKKNGKCGRNKESPFIGAAGVCKGKDISYSTECKVVTAKRIVDISVNIVFVS